MNEADKVEEHYAGHLGIPDGFTDWGEPSRRTMRMMSRMNPTRAAASSKVCQR